MDGRRALVIDDEVHFRYFLRVLLEKAGFAVKMARNGIEALDVLRSWRPDVITLDVMMPEQSGLTFYGAVCRNEDWNAFPWSCCPPCRSPSGNMRSPRSA